MPTKYKIVIAYDGTDYSGWQKQKEKLTVAKVLEDTFATVFNRNIRLYGVSRTDAGVHALGQVATFQADIQIEPQKMMYGWNNMLPESIVIQSLEIASADFHLHGSVIEKIYWYHFFLKRPLPFTSRYGWHYRSSIDVQKLQECLNACIGTHDFVAFSTGDERGEDTIRTINSAIVQYIEQYNAYRIEISGPKFLHHMVRRIVGACLTVASDDTLTVDTISQVLQAKKRNHELMNAPAKGLLLYKVRYKDES
jgi:tRNA pseudouridine38-40 synthase